MESGFFEISTPYELRISDACRKLNILNNPLLWTDEDVRTWCDWALGLYQVHPTRRRTLLNGIAPHHNGSSFSRLEPIDFDRLFHSAGVYVFAELELWKNATEISSTRLLLSTEFMSINQTAAGVTSTDDCLWSTDRVNRGVSSNSKSTDVTETSPVANRSSSSMRVTPVNRASVNSSESTADCHSSWNNIPTVVMHSELDDQEEEEEEEEEEDPMDEGDPWRDPGYGVSGSGASAAAAAAAEEEGQRRPTATAFDHRAMEETAPYKGSQSGHSNYTTVDNETIRGDRIPSPDDDDWQTYSKQGHHLWQFLQELLQRPLIYENCIRWIDKRQGIFKIGDSVRVAQLWGQRKNRPAMNYDKLSRSIRQYYKKGIIRKTRDSRRLVYQFCPMYNI